MTIARNHSREQFAPPNSSDTNLSIKNDSHARFVLPLLIAGVPATVFYAWFITNGTFNLFGAERHGLAYGSLLLHMLHGSLQVNRTAIGLEGTFIDGKVYMYYGILPALLRLPFVPFVNLAQTTVSRIVILILTVPAAAIWNYLLLQTLEPYRSALSRFQFILCLFAAALMAWLISPSYALCATAPIYHETIASALLLMAMFTLVTWRGMARDSRISERTLIYLSVIAALSVHARPTVAIGLYTGTVLFVALESVRTFRRNDNFMASIIRSARLASLPMLILLFSGLFYLWMNWVRWGAPFTAQPPNSWGYHHFHVLYGHIDGNTENPSLGRFSLIRIPANLIAYFLSDKKLATDVGSVIGSGLGRMVEPPSPMLILWLAPILIAAIGCRLQFLAGRLRNICIEKVILAIAIAIPALMLLSYPTVNYRYKLLLWPILFLCVLPGTRSIIAKISHLNTSILTACLLGFALLCTTTVVATSGVNVYYKLWRGIDEDGTRSKEDFFLTRLFVPKDVLSNLHGQTVSDLAKFEKRMMSQ